MARSLSLYTYLCGASGTVLEPGMHARAWLCPTLQPNGLWPARLLCPWESPGQSTGVGCHVLLQGIFLTQGSNLGPLHYRQILYQNPLITTYSSSFPRGLLALSTNSGPVRGAFEHIFLCFEATCFYSFPILFRLQESSTFLFLLRKKKKKNSLLRLVILCHLHLEN